MTEFFKTQKCVVHKRIHTTEELKSLDWSHRKWFVDGKEVEGWGCLHWSETTPLKPKVTQAIKDGRKQFKKELLQPFRNGELTREYAEAYPQHVSGMLKEGIISQREAHNPKSYWGNDID